MGGEAIIRLQAGPTWTGQPTDYWAPTNWFSLDNTDTDLGGVSATVVDVPGATPSQLVLALGKDSNAYLVDRNNLGGITSPVAQANVGGTNRGTSAVTYHTSQGTYIGFHNDANAIRCLQDYGNKSADDSVRMEHESERPRLALGHNHGWNKQRHRMGGWRRKVTSVCMRYDGDTGAVIYAGGGANELMTGTQPVEHRDGSPRQNLLRRQ